MSNGFASCQDPAALQQICDRLGPGRIRIFAERWRARLPLPFTRADRQVGYWRDISMRQVEVAATISPQLTGSADFWHPTGAASVVGIGEGGLTIIVERADAFGAIGMDGRAPVCLHHDRDGLLDRLALAHPDRLLDGLYRGG